MNERERLAEASNAQWECASSPGNRRRGLGSRALRRVLFVFGGIGVVAFVVVAAMIVAANRDSMPKDPKLDKVSLELPSSPPNTPVLKMLVFNDQGFRTYLDFALRHSGYLNESKQKKADRRALWREFGIGALPEPGPWLPDLKDIRRRLRALTPSIEQTRNELMAPGCLADQCQSRDPDSTLKIFNLNAIVRVLVVHAVSEIQLGEPDPPGWRLIALFDRLVDLTTCQGNVMFHLLTEISIRTVGEAFRFVLATPKSGPKLQQAIWQRLRSFDTLPTPMPRALVCLRKWFHDSIDQVLKENSIGWGGWPWFSKQHTLRAYDQLARRMIWLSGKPPWHAAWRTRTPEEKYLDRVFKSQGVLSLFRYNNSGLVLLSVISSEDRKNGLLPHRLRCRLAAQRRCWAESLQQRGRPVPAAWMGSASRNPFTGKVFSGKACDKVVCGELPDRSKGDFSLPLPPPPPAHSIAPEPPEQ